MTDLTKPRPLCTKHDPLADEADASIPDDEAAEDPDNLPDEDIAEEAE